MFLERADKRRSLGVQRFVGDLIWGVRDCVSESFARFRNKVREHLHDELILKTTHFVKSKQHI
jgi:hypothetical protein